MGKPNDLVQRTLDLLILQALSLESNHGWAISKRIQQISREQLHVQQGSLYPALYQLEAQRLINAEWKQSPSGRDAKFYALTAAGRKRLEIELENWRRLSVASELVAGTTRAGSHGAVYPLLHQLEHAGSISGRWQRDGGRHVKHYSLAAAAGRVLLRSTNHCGRAHLCGTATALAFSMAASAAAAQDTGALPHVRSSSPILRELCAQGTVQSPTFHSLVDAIGNTDGIVYIEKGHCGHGVHNCLLLSVIPAGGFRFLKILVDADRVHGQDSELIASMGHELRHALEVLAEPGVRSTIDMFSLYANQAAALNGHFETPAAVRAGDQVLSEISRAISHSRTFAPADIALTIDNTRTIVDNKGVRHGQTQ